MYFFYFFYLSLLADIGRRVVIDAQKRVQGDFLQNPTRQEGREGEKEGEQYRRRKRGNCRESEEQEEMRSRSEACDEDAMGE